MGSVASQFIQRTYQQPYQPAGIRRKSFKQAREMSICDSYEKFIWALAQKFTGSQAEAEAAAEEIFADIRRFGEVDTDPPPIEDRLVERIALRRLLMFLD